MGPQGARSATDHLPARLGYRDHAGWTAMLRSSRHRENRENTEFPTTQKHNLKQGALKLLDKIALGAILVTFAGVLAVGISINVLRDSLREKDEQE